MNRHQHKFVNISKSKIILALAAFTFLGTIESQPAEAFSLKSGNLLDIEKEALAANLVNNGDFEAVDYIGSYTTYNSTTVPDDFGWSISNDFIYLVNSFWSGVSGTTNPDGFDQSVELRPNVTLSQAFATQVEQNYELSLWYAHDPSNLQGSAIGHLNVQGNNSLLSNTFLHDLPSNRSNLQFLQYTAQFTADSDLTTLSFQGDTTNGFHGFVIDGVSVVEVHNKAKVPEPSSAIGLLTLSCFGVVSLLKRKGQKQQNNIT